MKINKLILLFFTFATQLVSQNFNWEYFPYEAEFDLYESKFEIVEDKYGSIYTVAYFKEVAYIDGDTLYADGFDSDLLIVKYKSNRTIEWYKEIDLNVYPRYFEVALDARENLLLAGRFNSSLKIDTFNLQPAAAQTAFITKISPDGEVQMLKSVLDGYPSIHAMSLDDYDNIYISGDGLGGGFFAMLDSEANLKWRWDINNPGGGNNVWAADIKKAPDRSVYGLLLWKSERINITDEIAAYSPYTWGTQMTLFKFDETGELIWYDQNKQGRFNEDAYLSVDNESNVYIAGSFNNATLELGDVSLPSPDFNRSYGFLAKCTPDKKWEWVTQRDPFPNLSKKMLFDCKKELIYAVGSSSLEVFNSEGVLIKQDLFDDRIYPHAVSIGRNDDILLCGLTRTKSFLEGLQTVDPHPFIVSIGYDWSICKRPAAPPIEEKIYLCTPTPSLTLATEGDNVSWLRSDDLNNVISNEETLHIVNPDSAIYFVSQNINGCESKKAKIEVIDLTNLQLNLDSDTLYAPFDASFAYSWTLEGVSIPSANSSILPVDSIGLYTVVINVGDCEFALTYELLPTLTQETLQRNINIYPTTFNNLVHIDTKEIFEKVHLKIFNINGMMLLEKPLPSNSLSAIKTSDLPAGTYVFSLITNNVHISKKLIKSQ